MYFGFRGAEKQLICKKGIMKSTSFLLKTLRKIDCKINRKKNWFNCEPQNVFNSSAIKSTETNNEWNERKKATQDK